MNAHPAAGLTFAVAVKWNGTHRCIPEAGAHYINTSHYYHLFQRMWERKQKLIMRFSLVGESQLLGIQYQNNHFRVSGWICSQTSSLNYSSTDTRNTDTPNELRKVEEKSKAWGLPGIIHRPQGGHRRGCRCHLKANTWQNVTAVKTEEWKWRFMLSLHNFLEELMPEFCMLTATLVTWRVCITVIILEVTA